MPTETIGMKSYSRLLSYLNGEKIGIPGTVLGFLRGEHGNFGPAGAEGNLLRESIGFLKEVSSSLGRKIPFNDGGKYYDDYKGIIKELKMLSMRLFPRYAGNGDDNLQLKSATGLGDGEIRLLQADYYDIQKQLSYLSREKPLHKLKGLDAMIYDPGQFSSSDRVPLQSVTYGRVLKYRNSLGNIGISAEPRNANKKSALVILQGSKGKQFIPYAERLEFGIGDSLPGTRNRHVKGAGRIRYSKGSGFESLNNRVGIILLEEITNSALIVPSERPWISTKGFLGGHKYWEDVYIAGRHAVLVTKLRDLDETPLGSTEASKFLLYGDFSNLYHVLGISNRKVKKFSGPDMAGIKKNMLLLEIIEEKDGKFRPEFEKLESAVSAMLPGNDATGSN